MNRRVALIWKWSAWSLFAAAATTGLAMWISRADTKPVDPGTRDVEGLTDDLSRALPKDVPALHFTDIAARLNLPSQFTSSRSTSNGTT